MVYQFTPDPCWDEEPHAPHEWDGDLGDEGYECPGIPEPATTKGDTAMGQNWPEDPTLFTASAAREQLEGPPKAPIKDSDVGEAGQMPMMNPDWVNPPPRPPGEPIWEPPMFAGPPDRSVETEHSPRLGTCGFEWRPRSGVVHNCARHPAHLQDNSTAPPIPHEQHQCMCNATYTPAAFPIVTDLEALQRAATRAAEELDRAETAAEIMANLSNEPKIRAMLEANGRPPQRHPAVVSLLGWLTPNENLPRDQYAIADECHNLAQWMFEHIADGPELTAGLRKLLEAKDCFDRASLDD